MRIAYSEKFLEHENPPEVSGRLKAIVEHIEGSKLPVEFEAPKKIDGEELLLVHTKRLVEELKRRSETEDSLPENPFTKKTFEIAKLACGGALRAAEIADEDGFSFALVRPPGHHAGRDFYHGFCYMNNIAVAVRGNWSRKKTLIVDFDVHAGNGTIDIFEGDDSVFYLSLHQTVRALFPYDLRWEGRRANINSVGLAPGADDAEYLRIFRKALGEAVSSFKPERVAVSAGFDAYCEDGIASLKLDTETYNAIGKEIAKLGLQTFAVLEGGYYLPDLGKNVWSFISAFR